MMGRYEDPLDARPPRLRKSHELTGELGRRGLQLAAKEHAESQGVLAYHFKSAGKRVPDFLFVFHGGETIFVEFKRPDGRGVVAKLQEKEIHEISKRGAAVYVCESLEAFKAIIGLHVNAGSKRGDR